MSLREVKIDKKIIFWILAFSITYVLGFGNGMIIERSLGESQVEVIMTYQPLDENISSKYQGLRFSGNYTHSQARAIAKKADKTGDWVAVNVRGLTYDRGVEICKHEMGHELVAEILEKDDTQLYKKFEEIIREYEDEQNI